MHPLFDGYVRMEKYLGDRWLGALCTWFGIREEKGVGIHDASYFSFPGSFFFRIVLYTCDDGVGLELKDRKPWVSFVCGGDRPKVSGSVLCY